MSLLTAINNVCDIVAHDRFDQAIGNIGAQSFVQHAQEATEEITRRVEWSRMLKMAAVGEFPFPLPDNFHRLVTGGSVRVDGAFARPVTSSGEWAIVKQVPSSQPYYFLRGGNIEFSPNTGSIEFDYVSNTPILGQDGVTEQKTFESDNDTPLFSERLLELGILWRWKRQKSLAYEDQLAEFEAALVQEIKADRGAAA